MKKFLVFFVVLFGVACSAMAGYQGNQPDPKGGEGSCILKPDDINSEPYAVYFKTAEDKVSNECKEYFESVKSELADLYAGKGIAYFVVIGSADQQGDKNAYDNIGLSDRRRTYVVNNILPNGAKAESVGWVAGSATARKFEPQYTGNWTYRSVYIYPVWARNMCTADQIKNMKANLNMLTDASKKYPDSADIKKLISNYQAALGICTEPNKALTKGESEKLVDLLIDSMALIKTVNAQYNIDLSQTTVIDADISRYYSKLTQLRDSLKVSAWRDAEGKFNTARLASDSIAGVVLGTVGGIVTSKLVKKNQLKRGFEDLSCNVGGQKVADYGDTFRVGLQ
ncbi:MAG: hypothetical protein IJQ90_00925 [Alphaproteobacteria bacterium]|nr:hypothetical protein [Alphaproteobacteria bacterium]